MIKVSFYLQETKYPVQSSNAGNSNIMKHFNFIQPIMKEQLIENVDPQFEQEYSTNQILMEQKATRVLYYIPCYVRFKVRQLVSIDIEGLKGDVSGTLLFSFYYGNLDRNIVDQFTGSGQKGILLQLTSQESILLKEDKGIIFKQDEKSKVIDFVVRQQFTCNLLGDVFYTPFEIINLFLTITIQSIVLDPKQNDGKRIDIKFNCMSSDSVSLISHGQKLNIGDYNMATHYLEGRYSNSDKNPFEQISVIKDESEQIHINSKKKIKTQIDVIHEESKHAFATQKAVVPLNDQSPTKLAVKKDSEVKIKNFQYANFRIPIYKYPGSNLVSIFIPLWVLGFINLLVFFQDPDFAGRIATIATLTLAFIAFIPTINQSIPKTPYVKLVQILIYIETLTTVLCLIDSLIISQNSDPDYKFVWNQDGWFLASMVLNILTVFVVLGLFIIHKIFWQKKYTAPRDESNKDKVLNRKNWSNQTCDQYFSQWIKSGKIKVI